MTHRGTQTIIFIIICCVVLLPLLSGSAFGDSLQEPEEEETTTVKESSLPTGVILPLLGVGILMLGAGIGVAGSPQIRRFVPVVSTPGKNDDSSEESLAVKIFDELYGPTDLEPGSNTEQDQGHDRGKDSIDWSPEDYKQHIEEELEQGNIYVVNSRKRDIEATAERILSESNTDVPEGHVAKIEKALKEAEEESITSEQELVNSLNQLKTNQALIGDQSVSNDLIDTLIDYIEGEASDGELADVIKNFNNGSSSEMTKSGSTTLKTGTSTNKFANHLGTIKKSPGSPKTIDETGEELITTLQEYDKGNNDVNDVVETVEETIETLNQRKGSDVNDEFVGQLRGLSSADDINVNSTTNDLISKLKSYERNSKLVDSGQVVDEIKSVNARLNSLEDIEQKATYYEGRLNEIDAQISHSWVEICGSDRNFEEPGDLAYYSLTNGYVGELVIRKAAQNVQSQVDNGNTGFSPGSKPYSFIKDLASAAATQDQLERIERMLQERAEQFAKYEQFEEFDRKDKEDINQIYNEIIDSLAAVSDPPASAIQEIADRQSKEAELIQDDGIIDQSLIHARLSVLADLLDSLQDKEPDQVNINTDRIDQRRSEVRNVMDEVENIRSGHQIADWYLNLADEFRQEARSAYDGGNEAKAQAYLNAEYSLVDSIYGMYTEDDLIDVLAWSDR